jgi:hypothetical protein
MIPVIHLAMLPHEDMLAEHNIYRQNKGEVGGFIPARHLVHCHEK